MRAGPFLSAVAAGLFVEEKTVRIFAREMRLAGLLSTGARGVNAPDMTIEDLANLIVAFLSTDRPSKAVEMLRCFGSMQLLERTKVAPIQCMPSNPSHSFLELMELWCAPAVTIPPLVRIEASGTAGVSILSESLRAPFEGGIKLFYCSKAEQDTLSEPRPPDLVTERGLVVSRSISSSDLTAIKKTVFGDVAQSTKWEA
jgi:hypothetical protein